MKWHTIWFILVLWQVLSTVIGLFATEDLYSNGVDLGITSFERGQINETLRNTTKPWLIQFYSSWCGHCQRFAPTFKKLGIRAQGWTDAIGIGVINCAQKYNTQTCRDYEIDGYPSLKLFSPNQLSFNVGHLIRGRELTTIINKVTNWIETLQLNNKTQSLGYVPNLTYLKSADPVDIWKNKNKTLSRSETAILIFSDEKINSMVNSLLLDFHGVIKSSSYQTIIRKVSISLNDSLAKGKAISQTIGKQLATNIGLQQDEPLPFIVAIRESRRTLDHQRMSAPFELKILKATVEKYPDAKQILNELFHFVSNPIPGTKTKLHGGDFKYQNSSDSSSYERKFNKSLQGKEVNEELVMKRRYTVYQSDLENALDYSILHEIAEKKNIKGKAFNALQHYLEVLIKLFPFKQGDKSLLWLQELYKWTNANKDGILGEDLHAKSTELKNTLSISSNDDGYIGCRGSDLRYGNYPCALWSLWHVLNAQQSQQKLISDPSFVLSTMVGYVKHFFGCRDCAENFLREAEYGAAIQREVNSSQDSILWLWNAHNKVNLRLMNDPETDDPAYPKFIFPDENICPGCVLQINDHTTKRQNWNLGAKKI